VCEVHTPAAQFPPLQLQIAAGDRRFVAELYDGAAIGRSPENAISIDEPTVSARHAVFETDGERIYIRDLGSTNGVVINGAKVQQAVISDGDEIEIGTAVCVVRATADAAVGATRIPDSLTLRRLRSSRGSPSWRCCWCFVLRLLS
jgi:hypothetical protein